MPSPLILFSQSTFSHMFVLTCNTAWSLMMGSIPIRVLLPWLLRFLHAIPIYSYNAFATFFLKHYINTLLLSNSGLPLFALLPFHQSTSLHESRLLPTLLDFLFLPSSLSLAFLNSNALNIPNNTRERQRFAWSLTSAVQLRTLTLTTKMHLLHLIPCMHTHNLSFSSFSFLLTFPALFSSLSLRCLCSSSSPFCDKEASRSQDRVPTAETSWEGLAAVCMWTGCMYC